MSASPAVLKIVEDMSVKSALDKMVKDGRRVSEELEKPPKDVFDKLATTEPPSVMYQKTQNTLQSQILECLSEILNESQKTSKILSEILTELKVLNNKIK